MCDQEFESKIAEERRLAQQAQQESTDHLRKVPAVSLVVQFVVVNMCVCVFGIGPRRAIAASNGDAESATCIDGECGATGNARFSGGSCDATASTEARR